MNARRVVALLVYFLVLLFAVAIAKGYATDKRVKQGASFQTMMRYGRGSTSKYINKDGKIVNVYPRADSFFLGTRYGKRSSWSPNASLVYPISNPPCGEDEDLSCSYTGISNLYRCNARTDATNDNV